MKFAAIALMAVVMFSADAEAKKCRKGVTAKCSIPDSEAEDAIKGGFFLRQRA